MLKGSLFSAVTLGELVTGVRRSRDQARNEEALQHFLRRVTVLHFTDATARRWGEEQARLLDAGDVITEFDLAIAVTAILRDLVLLTENRRHYERVAGLKLRSLADPV